MRRYIVVSVGVLAFVALVGAVLHTILALTREPSVVMSDTACTPPCWNSIRPGITTADEVFHLLNGSRTVDPLSLSERRSADEVVSTSWHFSPPSPDGTGRAYYIDETVAAIVIGTFGSVDLEEMLTKLGQPSYSWNYCEGGAEQSWTRILLFWPDGGYAVAVDSDPPCGESDQPFLSPADPVARVVYFDPGSFEELLRTRTVFGLRSDRATLEWEPWRPSPVGP
jgi:hypothetical protein